MLKIYILLLLVATLATFSTCKRLDGTAAVEKCSLENSVTEEELDKILQEYSEDTDGVDRRFKCYIKCLYNALKLTDDNGRLDATKFGNPNPLEPPIEHVAAMVNACNAKFSSVEDQCENMYKVIVCISLQLQNKEEEQQVLKLIKNNFTDVETS